MTTDGITRAHNLFIADGILYVASFWANDDIFIYDLEGSETSPRFVDSWDLSDYIPGTIDFGAHDVYVQDNRIYVAALEGGVFIATFDDEYSGGDLISRQPDSTWSIKYQNVRDSTENPGATFMHTHSVWPTDDGDYIFVTDEVDSGKTEAEKKNMGSVLRVFDISELDTGSHTGVEPVQWYDVKSGVAEGVIGSGNLPTDQITIYSSIHNVLIKDDYAYISYYTEGLRILDISDPEDLEEVGYYNTTAVNANPPTNTWYLGSFGVYPFLNSETILLSDEDGIRTMLRTPEIPSGFTVTGSVGQHPTLSWNANPELDLDGYNIYVKYGTGSWGSLTSVDENTTSWVDPGVTITSGRFDPTVCYRITAFLTFGDESDYTNQRCVISNELSKALTDIETLSIPTEYSLEKAYPNPFNPSTNITYSLPEEGFISIKVYDKLGRIVSTLVNDFQKPGYYSIQFNGQDLASGVYFYRIEAGNFQDVKKMILLK